MDNIKYSLENIKSEELKEIVSETPRWIIRNGSALFLIIAAGFLFLSYLIKYPEKIASTVIITSEDPPQKIYTYTSGKIDTVFCKNNESIKAGQKIAMIENTANLKDVELLKLTINNHPFTIETLEFPIDDLPILLLGEIEDSFIDFENSYLQYILLKKYKDYDIKTQSSLFSIAEKNKKLQSLNFQIDINNTELKIKKEDLDRYKVLFKKGIISKQELEKREVEFLQTRKLAKNTELSISELNNDLTISHKNLKLNNIDKLRAQKQLIKEMLQNFNKLKISLKLWETKYLIQSSRSGIVSYSSYRKKNDFINKGKLFASVVPNEGIQPIAELRTPVSKSGKVEIGQRVNIMLDNYPYLEYGMLVGKVINISLLPDDENMYLINVKLDKKLTTTYNKKLKFRHQMVGRADIITKKISLLERIFFNLRSLIFNN